MKLLVLADLHLDHWLMEKRDPLCELDQATRSNVAHCIVAGDLCNKGHKRWTSCLEWVASKLPNAQVWVFPGNHDYYDGRIDREDKLEAAAESVGAHFAQKRSIEIDGHRFLCCTLWTNFNLFGEPQQWAAMHDAGRVMNDYRYIRVERKGYGRLEPRESAAIHADHRGWLDAELAKPFDGETIVVTHHAPHPKVLSRAGNSIDAAYASDLSRLIERHQPAWWIHGHTHRPTDFVLGRTRVANASTGYPEECPEGTGGRSFVLLDTDHLVEHDLRLDGGDTPAI